MTMLRFFNCPLKYWKMVSQCWRRLRVFFSYCRFPLKTKFLVANWKSFYDEHWMPALSFFVVPTFLLISCTFVITAITTVVTIAEILKNNGLAIEKSKKFVLLMPKSMQKNYVGSWFGYLCLWDWTEVSTSTVGMKDENKGRLVQKAKVGFFSWGLFSWFNHILWPFHLPLISFFFFFSFFKLLDWDCAGEVWKIWRYNENECCYTCSRGSCWGKEMTTNSRALPTVHCCSLTFTLFFMLCLNRDK